MSIHVGEKQFRCHICPYKCNRKDNFERHVRIHDKDKQFCCRYCLQAFSEKAALEKHLETHIGTLLEQHWSSILCNKETNLAIHTRIHDKKLYKCDICLHEFSKKVYLKKHMSIHNGEKQFRCHICPYECNRKDNFERHVRIHDKDCPYTSDKRNTLEKNMRIHDEEKLSKCDQLIQEVSNEHHEITSSKEEFERRDPIIHVEKKPLQ